MGRLSRRKRYEARQEAEKALATSTPAVVIEQAVERARGEAKSLQPRFSAEPGTFYSRVATWLRRAETEEPPYASKSKARDSWLMQFVQSEPHISGILSSTASIDSNRGWTLTGGRNQVRRFTRALHNFGVAADIKGWRPGTRAMSMQFHGTDLGAAVEIGRDGEFGPLAGFYSVDPSRCILTGDINEPLEYSPPSGKAQRWRPEDYLRVTDIGYNVEEFNGLGYCAVSRCLELAKVMVAVLLHDQEQLLARMPKGLLLLKGISESMWQDVMSQREADLTAKERKYYGGVQVLAGATGMEDLSAVLVALSELPANFDMEVFTNLTMYGYSLCFGYDAREFWPVSGGALGTATETEVQHRKATQKGAGDFSLNHQEQIQREDIMPDTLEFGYDERDVGGELQEIEVNTAVASLVNSIMPILDADPEIARQRALQILAEHSVVPQEWTEYEEDVTATDEEDADLENGQEGTPKELSRREKLLARESVQRACEAFPREPLVSYHWRAGLSNTVVLSRTGEGLLKRRTYPAYNNPRLIKAERLLEAAMSTAKQLEAPIGTPPWYGPGFHGEHHRYIDAELPKELDMPQLSLVIRDNLPIEEMQADIEAQIEALRASASERIQKRAAREKEAEQRHAEQARLMSVFEETLTLMRQVVEAQLAEREKPIILQAHITTPPIILPAPIVQLPPPTKRRVTLIKADGKTSYAEIE